MSAPRLPGTPTAQQAADAHMQAQKLINEAEAARALHARAEGSLFRSAYADAKAREAHASVVSASAQARWAAWSFPMRVRTDNGAAFDRALRMLGEAG